AFAAAFLAAGKSHVLAQDVEQPLHRRHAHAIPAAVHREGERAHALPSPRSARIRRSGRAGISPMRAPVASAVAFTTEGAGASMGSSPTPFAPCGPCE